MIRSSLGSRCGRAELLRGSCSASFPHNLQPQPRARSCATAPPLATFAHLHGAHASRRSSSHAPPSSRSPTSCAAMSTAAASLPSSVEAGLRSSSLVLLLQECFKRAAGRPLIQSPAEDLLRVPALADAMSCCLLIAEPCELAHGHAMQQPNLTDPADGSRSGSGSGGTSCSGLPASRMRVTYANEAARQLFSAPPLFGLQGEELESRTFPGSGSRSGSERTIAAGHGLVGSSLVSVLAALQTGDVRAWWQVPSEIGVAPRIELLQGLHLRTLGSPRRPALSPERQTAHEDDRAEGHDGHQGEGGLGSSADDTGPPGASFSADVLVCDVCSPSGRTLGRALLLDDWRFEDGRIGRPLVQSALLPTEVLSLPQNVAGMEEVVRMQADGVRKMKSEQGMGNQDPRVQQAIAELQAAKAVLAAAQALLEAFSSDCSLSIVRGFTQQQQQQQP